MIPKYRDIVKQDSGFGPAAIFRYAAFYAVLTVRVLFPAYLCVCGIAFAAEKEGLPDEYADTQPAGTSETRFEDAGRLLCKYIPVVHLMHTQIGPAVSARAWTNYLNSVDPQKLYFLESDIDEFEKYRIKLGKMLGEGDLSFAELVFSRLKERVSDRGEFVAGLFGINLKDIEKPAAAEEAGKDGAAESGETTSESELLVKKEPFAFDTAETYDWNRDDAAWPATETERDDIWRRLVKDDYLRQLVNEALDKEEKASFGAGKAAAGSGTNSVALDISSEAMDTPETRNKIAKVIIRNHLQYIDTLNDCDREYYVGNFLDSFSMAFDPHSNYMSPVKLEDFSIGMNLSLQGIGATLRTYKGAARVVEIIPGSPAERDMSETRLVPGDMIVSVAQGDDGEFVDIMHWPLYKAVHLIRGDKGSVVRLKVIPSSDASGTSTKIVRLVRDDIRLEEQAASSALKEISDGDGVSHRLGYINLPSFYTSSDSDDSGDLRTVTKDMKKLLAGLNDDGVEGLVLDLRSNGGGSLAEAVSVAGLFINYGPIVLVRERLRRHVLRDTDSAVAFKKPLVVLVNRLSASASEIVAGALQDYGRAVIVGDSHTHGKGTVQTVLPLGDEDLGSMKITTASFYRVTGASTQLKGVESDIHVPSVFEGYPKLGEDNLPNAMPWSRIGNVYFTRVADLGPAIKYSRSNTLERLSANADWDSRMKLLDRMSFLNTNTVISLVYNDRLAYERESRSIRNAALHENERALIDGLSDENEKDKTEPETEEKAPVTPEEREKLREEHKKRVRDADIVLNEAYRILLDLIHFEAAGGQSGSVGEKRDFFSEFFN